ncbi:unnamed protein product, partial [marine sediment metagenome]
NSSIHFTSKTCDNKNYQKLRISEYLASVPFLGECFGKCSGEIASLRAGGFNNYDLMAG